MLVIGTTVLAAFGATLGQATLSAAAQGQGVALTSFAIAADELAAGSRIQPFKTSVSTPFGYYFVCRPGETNSTRIKALREFLNAEAALSSEPG